MTTVALTGGTGTFGRHVCRELRRRDHRVRALHRPGSTPPPTPGVEWIEGSLEDGVALDALVDGTDAIIHLAYSPLDAAPTAGRTVAEQFAESNLVGTVRLIERAPRTRFGQLLFTSSLAVFGSAPFRVPGAPGRMLTAETAAWPREFYGAHKAALEKLVYAASETWGLNTSIWRLGWIVADYDDPDRDPLAGPLREALDTGQIREQHAAYLVAADDAAAILCSALGDSSTRGHIHHVFDRWIDSNELAAPLSKVLGRPVVAAAPPAPPPEPGIDRSNLAGRDSTFMTMAAIERRLRALLSAIDGGP